jgi:hypothetical protein
LDTVCGIPGSRTEIVMLKPPGDGTRLELSSFVRPESVPGSPAAMANELGLRNVAFEVNDLQPLFCDFKEMFTYAHLEGQYSGRAWVLVDGDPSGCEVVEKLPKAFSGWNPEHFHSWSHTDIEHFYPQRLQVTSQTPC